MRIVAITGVKGGMGTTTLTAALAEALLTQGHPVLAIDLTPQNDLRLHLGMPWQATDGLASRIDAGESWLEGAWVSAEGVRFLPFGERGERSLTERFDHDREWLRRALHEIDFPVDGWVLIDTPVHHPSLLAQALAAAHAALLVATPEPATHARLATMEREIQQAAVDPLALHLAINRFDPTVTLQREIVALMKTKLAGRLAPVEIPEDPRMAEALASKRTVVGYAPGSGVASRIGTLALWLKARAGLRTAEAS